MQTPRSRIYRILSGVPVIAALCVSPAHAASFGVSPIRLDFDRATRTGVVNVSNDDSDSRIQFQLKLFEWRQDQDGKDRYEDSADLIFFPRVMVLEPREKRLVRVGLKVPAIEREKAYRLFIEEMPEPLKAPTQGARVAVTFRFGVPIFLKPIKEQPAGVIENALVEKGTLTVSVRNTGNLHFIIHNITATAGDLYRKEMTGWYLLPGAERSHRLEIPPEVCPKLDQIELRVRTDKLDLKRTVPVSPGMCRS